MKINEKLLQFYSFTLDKDVNNLVNKDSKETLESLFHDEVKTLFSLVEKECKKENIILKLSNNKHCHEILGNHKNLLIKIINKCYEHLCEPLLQKFEYNNENKAVLNGIHFYQCAINTRSRLIFVLKQDEFIPIIFDLKHVIYPTSDKKFDNNSKQEIYRWEYCCENKKVEIWK